MSHTVQGIETRASLDMSGMNGNFSAMPTMGGMKMMAPQLRAGRVIIGVADPGHADIFRSAYAQVSSQIEVVPAMGPENVWSTCQQVCELYGCQQLCTNLVTVCQLKHANSDPVIGIGCGP